MTDDDLDRLADLIAARLVERFETASNVLDTSAAAQYIGMSKQFLEIGRVRGGGPSFVKVGRAVRYRRVDLDAWLAARVKRNTARTHA